MGLDQFDEAAVERKTKNDERPSSGFAQCGGKGQRCVGNEMMGFVGTWNFGKRVQGMQRQRCDAHKQDGAQMEPVALNQSCHCLAVALGLEGLNTVELVKRVAQTGYWPEKIMIAASLLFFPSLQITSSPEGMNVIPSGWRN